MDKRTPTRRTGQILLNNKRHVSQETVPWKSGLLRGKQHVFAAHNIVRITLGPHVTIRQAMKKALHAPRRRHDVAAHFAHWHLIPGCIHRWPAIPDVDETGIPRWVCEKCNGLRVRRRAHLRGSAEQGVVTKDYHVTK